jgi:hypothetical protein
MPDLIMLEDEDILERVTGVMNLSKDYGQLGILWVTSMRICWAAQLQENYNCSMPYLQVCVPTTCDMQQRSNRCLGMHGALDGDMPCMCLLNGVDLLLSHWECSV